MFSVSGGSSHGLLPGIQGVAGRAAQARGPPRPSPWAEAARRLEGLSRAEVRALSSQTAQLVSKLLAKPLDSTSHSWEQVFSSAMSAITSQQYQPPTRSFLHSSGLLGHASPLLISARGFKTRSRGASEQGGFSAFSRLRRGQEGERVARGDDKRFQEVLAKLNISQEEKEKVHIALLSFASGASAEGEGRPGEAEGAKATRLQTLSNSFWSNLNRFAIILFIVVCLMTLAQIYGVPSITSRISKLTNEVAPEDIDVTFNDVKGCDEAKEELQEIVEFLMNPDKFSALGGKLPKGCLLVGPPGTGKTLLARAVAGEAGVPFFYASGSEFDEVLVGQGARRVRDLFKAAKEKAPCVIFLDEIDSVGGKRTGSDLHPYANQTINQLLNEMDGFISNEGVIVLGATNMKDHLDKALLRPGRFDTQVEVAPPDVKGRREILAMYLDRIKHDASVDLESLASRTTGLTGAELESLVNTAAIHAATEDKQWVTMADLEWSYDKQSMGTTWRSRVRPRSDLEITAYHEAGHTLVAYLTQHAMKLHKVTILAKGGSGGHTAFTPSDSMQWHQTKEQMKARMDVGMGGRVAEELVFGKEKVTGGASSDLEGATNTAEYMVKYLGMSDKVGLRTQHRDPRVDQQLSPAIRELTDSEIKALLDESYQRATALLSAHRKELGLLAEALLKYETLDAEDVKCIVENKRPPTKQAPPPPGSLVPGLGRPLQPLPLPALQAQDAP